MEYLKIRNWDRWQSYRSDRGQPPWIKVHRCVMRNPEWVTLSDSERGQLISIWLLAADNNGLIPASSDLIEKLCFMSSPLNLNKFIELDFICQPDVTMTPERRQLDPLEKSRVDKNREDKNKKTFLSDSIEYRLSDYLYRFILGRNPNYKKPNLIEWSRHIDLMLRVDNRDSEKIKGVIKWCQNDTPDKQPEGSWKGWANNILSTKTLRKQYDKLILKMNENNTIYNQTFKQPSLEDMIS